MYSVPLQNTEEDEIDFNDPVVIPTLHDNSGADDDIVFMIACVHVIMSMSCDVLSLYPRIKSQCSFYNTTAHTEGLTSTGETPRYTVCVQNKDHSHRLAVGTVVLEQLTNRIRDLCVRVSSVRYMTIPSNRQYIINARVESVTEQLFQYYRTRKDAPQSPLIDTSKIYTIRELLSLYNLADVRAIWILTQMTRLINTLLQNKSCNDLSSLYELQAMCMTTTSIMYGRTVEQSIYRVTMPILPSIDFVALQSEILDISVLIQSTHMTQQQHSR